jgi:hypothetical protein
LLKTWESSVHEVSVCDYVGAGDGAFLRYLSGLLLTQRVNLRIGSVIASYLVGKAKELVDGCGGETDLVQMREDGTVHSFHGGFKDKQIHMAEFLLKQFIRTVFIPTMSDNQRNEAFQNLSASLSDLFNS